MSLRNLLLSAPGEQRLTLGERINRFPWGFLLLLLLIGVLGLAVLFSAVGGMDRMDHVLRQAGRLGASFGLMLAVGLSSQRFFRRNAYTIYMVILVLLGLVDLSGVIGMGAQRWLEFGPLRLQPSELMKVAVVLALARYFHDRGGAHGVGWRDMPLPFVMLVIPLLLIVKQPDLGTAIMVGAAGFMVIFVAGLAYRVLLGLMVLGGAALPLAWTWLHDYQRQRIRTLFSPEQDPLGAGYHIIQSKIAVGSGGWMGKGFLGGSQSHLDFLPERHTDFIFSVLAEEWGFLGALVLLILYALVVVRGLWIAATAGERFGLLTATGVVALFGMQVVVNVGMVLGMLPVVGLPLPLVSYGGSSMVTIMIAMGLLAHVSIHSRGYGRGF
ncbi:MAG: rod shape-determining protein RodA [Magnetococcus sp. WYHC-3]